MRTRSALLVTLVSVLTLALPSTAGAAVYQYGCCSTSSGVTLKTTNGWWVRVSNNKNTPSGKWYRIAGYYDNGTTYGVLYDWRETLSQTASYSSNLYSSRHECTNISGYFVVNVSCWTIE